MKYDFALIIPMANEESSFESFITLLIEVLDELENCKIILIVDKVSKDNTYMSCKNLSKLDNRFVTVWAPENKNVVDAYIRGYKEALKSECQFIIEMDAGLSHDPKSIPLFLQYLNEGYECVFGSRFINGGSMIDSSWKRIFLSKYGTISSNLLLGTKLHDMTSGYQGFQADIVEKFVHYKLLAKGHFYQTELRYLLRKTNYIEIPINYTAPSPSISIKSIINSFYCLSYYFFRRLIFKSQIIE